MLQVNKSVDSKKKPAKVMHICEKVLVHYFCWLNFHEPAKVMHTCKKSLMHYFCWLNFDEPAKVMHICEKVLVHYFCWLNFHEPAKVIRVLVDLAVSRFRRSFFYLRNLTLLTFRLRRFPH
jgi:hypothetical protein